MPTLPGEPQQEPPTQGKPGETFDFADSLRAPGRPSGREADGLLRITREVAQDLDPARSARILKAQFASGFDEKFIEEDLEGAEKIIAERDFDPAKARREHPYYAAWLSKSKHHVAVTKNPDVHKAMADLERIYFRRDDTSRPLSQEERARTIERRYKAKQGMTREMYKFDPFKGLYDPEAFGMQPDGNLTPEQAKDLEAKADKDLRAQIEAQVEDEERFVAGREPLGVVESFTGPQAPDAVEWGPFSGSLFGFVKDGTLFAAAKALESPEGPSDEQEDLLFTFGRVAAAFERRGQDFWAKAATLTAGSAKFAAEFGGTAGAYRLGKAATATYLRQAVKKVLSGRARSMVRGAAGSVVGAAVQAPLAMSGEIARGVLQRMSPTSRIEVKDGELVVEVDPGSGKAWYAAIPLAFADAFSDTLTERFGGGLAAVLPKNAVTGLLFGAWSKRTGGGAYNVFVETAKRSGIHGIVSQIGEEEWSKLLKSYISDAPDYALPLTPGGTSAEDLAAQAVSFGVFPAAGGVLSAFQGRRERARAEQVVQIIRESGLNVEKLEAAGVPTHSIRSVIASATKGTEQENVYVDVDTLTKLFQTAKDETGAPLSPRNLIQEVLGSTLDFDRAAPAGGSVRIPTADYHTHPALRPWKKALEKEVRFSPTEKNLREAEEDRAEVEAQVKQFSETQAKAEKALEAKAEEIETAAAALSKEEAARDRDILLAEDLISDIQKSIGRRIYWADAKGERNVEELVQSGVPRNLIADPKKAKARPGYAMRLDEVAERYGMDSEGLIDALSKASEARRKAEARVEAGEVSERARSTVRAKALAKEIAALSGDTEAGLEHSASEVKKAVERQLREEGFDVPTADAYAALHQAFFKAMGGRADVDPAELFSKYGLKIKRADLAAEKKKQTTLRQEEGPRLSALHNISERGLAFADQMGGLPVPSIAVVKRGMGMTGFGEITLIGTKDLADPEQVPAFDADAYSQRFPRPEYKKVPIKKARPTLDEFLPLTKAFDEHASYDQLWESTIDKPDPERAMREVERGAAGKAWFLASIGEVLKPVTRQIGPDDLQHPWVARPVLREFMARVAKEKIDLHPTHSPEAWAEYSAAVKAAVREYAQEHLAAEGKAEIDGYTDLILQGLLDGEDGQLYFGRAQGIEQSLRRLGATEVDDAATREAAEKAIEGKEIQFQDWLKKKIGGLFGAPLLKRGRRLEPYTLSNIVDAMTGTGVKAQEETMTFGEGLARASAATRFDDLEWMRNASHQIAPEAEVSAARETAKKLLAEYREKVLDSYTGTVHLSSGERPDTWAGLDASMRAVAAWSKRRQGGAAGFRRALEREGFRRVPDDVLELGMQASTAFIDAPVPYFETKPQRAVKLSEFAGAVIPAAASARTKEILEKHGVPFRTYEAAAESAQSNALRNQAVDAFREELAEEGKTVLFQSDPPAAAAGAPAPLWYSKLERLIEEKMPGRAPAAQVRSLIKDMKEEERKWYRIEDFLAGKDVVTRTELLEWLRGHRLNIVEVKQGGDLGPVLWQQTGGRFSVAVVAGVPIPSQEIGIAEDLNNPPTWSLYAQGEKRGTFDTIEEAMREGEILVEDGTVNLPEQLRPRFAEHTLSGGEDYQEILFTMPPVLDGIDVSGWSAQFVAAGKEGVEYGTWEVFDRAGIHVGFFEGASRTEAIHKAAGKESQALAFSSSHFPGVLNIVAHARVNYREDSDGRRVLFVEEVQSDWHQRGRRHGYKEAVARVQPIEIERVEQLDGAWRVTFTDGTTSMVGEGALPDGATEVDVRDYYRSIVEEKNRDARVADDVKVPDAPFRKTWHEFVMKRIVRMAAEKGIDVVAWTTGEQQAARYDLSKQVDRVEWFEAARKLYAQKDGDVVFHQEGVTKENLEDYVGKELADKLLAKPPGSRGGRDLEGLDLKVGGEGMKGFYDKMIPAFVSKFTKAYGGQVKTLRVKAPDEAAERMARSTVSYADGRYWLSLNDSRVSPYYRTVEEAFTAREEATKGAPVHAVEIPDSLKAAALGEGFPMFQPGEEAGEPLGQISFGKDRKFEIELLRKMNLSTFLHESGHFFLEIMADLAESPNASPQLRKDFKTVLDWMGVKDRAGIKRAQHEKWAEAFEKYLESGHAPSVGLRAAFEKFASWIKWVYKKIRGLKVDLSPEVKLVMDRMLASEREIEAATAAQGYRTLDPAALSMDPAEAEEYAAAVERAIRSAEADLTSKRVAGVMRAEDGWWNDEFDAMKEQVAAEIDVLPVYNARSILRNNTFPDGTRREQPPIKLDMKTIVEQYGGKARLKKLGFLYAKEGGLTPDMVAREFGFTSGDELLTAIESAEPRQILIERLTKERMEAKYGEKTRPEDVAQQSAEALHNEDRSELLMKEIAKLSTLTPTGRKASPLRLLREHAERTIREERFRDVNPAVYQRAASKANKAAFKAVAARDFDQAFVEKQREILNNELYRAAAAARAEVQKVQDHMARYDKKTVRANLGKAQGGYLEQIDEILERFEFRLGVAREIEAREPLRKWVDKQEAEGYQVVVPDVVLNEAYRTSYRDMTVEEILGLYDTVRNIEHLAGLKNKLLKDAAKRDLDEGVSAGVASIQGNSKGARKKNIEPHLALPSLLRGIEGGIAAHWKFATLVQIMDGAKDGGAMWELLVRPLNEAGNREAVMREQAAVAFDKLFSVYSSSERAGMYTKRAIEGFGGSLSKMAAITAALNVGNKDSRIKLMDGYAWTEEQLEAVLDTLDKKDWDFVQSVWDYIDTFWAESEALMRRGTGLPPVKVQASEIETRYGVYKGGYYPLKYDYAQNAEAASHRAANLAKDGLQGAVLQATTRRGHLKERVKGVKLPIRLDFSPMFEHVIEVIHDQTHYEFLLDSMRILRDRRMKEAITTHYGAQTVTSLVDALTDVARGERSAMNGVEASLGWLRSGASVAAMGWGISTAAMQPFGLTQSIVKIGAKWVAKGIGRWMGDAAKMENTVAWVHAKSDMMRLRSKTVMREVNEIRNAVAPQSRASLWVDAATEAATGGKLKLSKISDSYFFLLTRFQMAVDIPTWIGAYEKALAEGEAPDGLEGKEESEKRAVALADQAVLDSQGGGQVKDLAAVQRGGPLMKLWTTFYSYANTTANLTRLSVARTNWKKPKDWGLFLVDMVMLYSLPATLAFLMKEWFRGGGDDDEKFMKRMLAEQAAYLFGTFTISRELTGALQGYWGYEGPAGARGFVAAAKLIREVGEAIEEEEIGDGLWKAANQAGGIFFHYPSGQLQKTVTGFQALEEGETQNYRALLFGPERKR